MKKLTTIITTLIILSFAGCNQSATSVLQKEPIFGQNLQYTKVGKIIDGEEVQALINITYLNSVDSKQWNNGKQNFLVGTYIASSEKTKYSLTMNEQAPITIQNIPANDKTFQNIALENQWAIYEIQTFDDTDEKKLHLLFKDSKDNNTTITFIKE